jgi:alcohol dehydrogenase class IV
MVKLGVADRVRTYMKQAGFEVLIFDDVEPEPSTNTVKSIIMAYAEDSFDVIVGLGGGSAIDASKGFRIFYEYPELDIGTAVKPGSAPAISFRGFKKTTHICISSTSGTGSDASYACVLTHSETGMKVPILHQDCIPEITICDPDLSDTMPDKVRLDSGLDALTHAVESYINDKTNVFSKSLSLKSVDLVMRHFLKAFLEKDPEAMAHMHYAATLAGMGFSNSANGIAHTVGDKVGPPFKLTHGLACGLALPFTIHYNRREAEGHLAELAGAIGYQGNEEQSVTYLLDRILGLYQKLGVPAGYKAAGIPEDAYTQKIKDFVERSIHFPPTLVNPRKSKAEDLEILYTACFYGDYSKL